MKLQFGQNLRSLPSINPSSRGVPHLGQYLYSSFISLLSSSRIWSDSWTTVEVLRPRKAIYSAVWPYLQIIHLAWPKQNIQVESVLLKRQMVYNMNLLAPRTIRISHIAGVCPKRQTRSKKGGDASQVIGTSAADWRQALSTLRLWAKEDWTDCFSCGPVWSRKPLVRSLVPINLVFNEKEAKCNGRSYVIRSLHTAVSNKP